MQRLNINAVPDGFPQVLYYSQGDIGRQFIINVEDFTIPSGAVVKIQATKPSGLGFSVTGTVSGSAVTFTTTAEMTDEAGRYPAELQITSGSDVIGTANFTMNGELNPHPEGTTDGQIGTIIPELTLLVEEIRNSNAKVESMTASAVPLASDSDPTASYDAEDNNLEFGIPVPEVTESEFLKAFIVETASGDIASFTDGADDVPVKSLSVNIAPKQSGSGDPSPSNVRPISGWDEVEVVRCGKNIAHISDEIINNDRVIGGLTFHALTPCEVRLTGTPRNTVYMTTDYGVDNSYLRLLKAGTYTLSSNIPSSIGGVYVTGYPVGGGSVVTLISSATDGSPKTATLSQDYMANIQMVVIASSTAINKDVWIQLEKGSTATAYEPYEAETKSITLPSTVYGGTLDVTSGVLNVEWGIVDLGSLTWGTYNGKFTSVLPIAPYQSPNVGKATLVCEIYKTGDWGGSASQGEDTIWITGASSSATLYVEDTTYSSVNDFKTAVTGKHMAYKVKTPTTIQLTPTQVTTLLGNNNIWSDAGTVEVEYRADSTLAYNELLSLIANM